MVLDLMVIGTAITLGPLHNSAFTLLLCSRRGVRQALAFLLSWPADLIAVIAVVVLLTGGQPPARHRAPSTAAIAAKLAIGLALVPYGAHRRHRPEPARPTALGRGRQRLLDDGSRSGVAAAETRWGVPGPAGFSWCVAASAGSSRR
ncbi:GAP family protein [Streptomyces sp. NPDC052494]|uniref:GAP family protein n=1 Tax=Streptomyces sp. NPDC052494 TaxID=3365692 RepID=UPI0037CED3C2